MYQLLCTTDFSIKIFTYVTKYTALKGDQGGKEPGTVGEGKSERELAGRE